MEVHLAPVGIRRHATPCAGAPHLSADDRRTRSSESYFITRDYLIQGLLVERLQKSGHKFDGVDLSPQMVRHAEMRRGVKLIEADARSLPFASETYNTAIIATGVVDFLEDDGQIGLIVNEARRVTEDSGKVLVGFHAGTPRPRDR